MFETEIWGGIKLADVKEFRIGIDIGGTFTDFVALNLENMEIYIAKVPSTPKNLLIGIQEGLNEIMDSLNLQGDEFKLIGHGTTAAINALIERKGAKTALITTDGFRDLLEIGELYRPRERLYDPFKEKEEPFIRRRYRIGVKERINFKGEILEQLDEEDLLEKISWLKREGIESISICTLFSYINPIHENKIGDIIQKNYPNISTSLSSRISPEMGEYKRTCTTVAESYIKPIISQYVRDFEKFMRKKNIGCPICLMRGDGGLADLKTAVENPSRLLLSGPVGGVTAALYLGKLVGRNNLLTLDMGGTSCDTSMIIDGEAQEVTEREAGGMPITGPFIHIVTIGAGGGSIARVNEVGELLVGPESAGSDPGPVCYKKGGTEPTVTDANLVLGLLNPETFAKIRVSTDDARVAIEKKIANPLNMTIEEAALAIRNIIDSKLAGALRLVSVEKGLDPSDFSLVIFGAAGPLEAVNIADDLGITEIIIPRYPGVFCALGMLLSDFKYNYLQTIFLDLKDESCEEIENVFKILEKKVEDDIFRGEEVEAKVLIRSLDMRYWKQSYVLNIPIGNGIFDLKKLKAAAYTFTEKHKELYGFIDDIEKIKIINARLGAFVKLKRPIIQKHKHNSYTNGREIAEKGMRKILGLNETVKVYDRERLTPGTHLEGPVIVEAKDTTIWIPSDHYGKVDEIENLIIRKV
jgi:N-methylhydantoinase A